jgi:hypothetical protein
MVREYVERLYTPAAHAHRSLTAEAARELATWKARVRAAWPRITVDHVEASSATTTAELGTTLSLRVRVGLGDLAPDDVEVQAVAGRVDTDDRIADAVCVPLKPTGGPDLEGRWVYEGPLSLDRTGSSVTRSASCRPTACSLPGRNSDWWRCLRRRWGRERAC